MKHVRKIGVFLILTALVLMLIPTAGLNAATDTGFKITDGVLTAYTGTATTVSVPSTVTTIGESAFENNTTVERIVLPDSVTKIEPYAFWGCKKLGVVTLGKGLKQIGDYAFTNCTGLKSMSIPSGVTSIGIQTFSYCRKLETIVIPESVTAIDDNAFEGDYLLTISAEQGSYAYGYAQDFYEKQKEMTVYPVEDEDDGTAGDVSGGDSAGGGSTDGDTNILYEIPTTDGSLIGSTHIVGNRAVVIMQGSALTVLDGEDTSGAADGANENGTSADGDSAATDSTTIPERYRYRDETVTDEVIPDGTLEIGAFAYARSSLTNVSLPDGLTKIGYAAFYHCDNLTEVTIPDTVTEVDAKAFAHTPWVEQFDGDYLISGGVLVAYGGTEATDITVPDGVRVIAGEAFADHTELKTVTLPDSVVKLADDAFAGCALESLNYSGDALGEELLSSQVSVDVLAVAPGGTAASVQWTKIAAVVLLLAGSVCVIVHKPKRLSKKGLGIL